VSESVTPWLHILAVAVWVGPQFFLFIAAVPAIREIEDMAVRARVMRTITTRFGWMAWAALGVIVLTGISNLFQEGDQADLWDTGLRWFSVFSTKMVLVGIMVALTAVHSFLIGPRQLELMEREETGDEALRLRRAGIALSGVVLLISVIVIFLGALLNNHEWSFQQA
jgi:uncharacterized membrane protein